MSGGITCGAITHPAEPAPHAVMCSWYVFNWGQIMTGALLGAAPPLIIYAFLAGNAGARDGGLLRLAVDLNNMHLLNEVTGAVI